MTKRTVTVDERNRPLFAGHCRADDAEAVAEFLRTQHNSANVVVYDERTCHLGYWDKGRRTVDTGALKNLQDAGYSIIYAGTKSLPESGREHPWIEARLLDPRDVVGGE